MSCSKRISETASDPSYIYQIFACVIENTRYIDRIRFFKQVKDEIDRIIREKQSPEIIALVGDWGQGKSTFLDIIEEYGRNNKLSITRIPFTKLLDNPKNLLTFKNGVYLIDEVESSVDYFSEYQQEIKDFWKEIKELANSEGNSTIYLSMTPSAYSKVFGIGGYLYSLFPETYQALLERIRKITLGNPSKLEFLLMLDCMLKSANIRDSELLEYMDLPYWVIDQERRKYVRFFNDIICNNYPNLSKIFNELARSERGIQLNTEGETIKLDILAKLENSLDKEEIEKLYKALMSRIFTQKDMIIKQLENNIIKGFLVPYNKWIEVFPKNTQDYIEDFLLTHIDNKLFIFLSDDLEKVVYEGIDVGKVKEIVDKLRPYSTHEAYALSWSFFESVVNTNIGGLVVEFKSREIRDKALQFVNSSLTDREKELDAIEYFIEIQGIKILDKKRLNTYTRLLKLNNGKDSFNIILTKPVDNKEIEDLSNEIEESVDIIHGVIIIESQVPTDRVIEILERIAIPYIKLTIPTPKKRQLLYLLFSKIYQQSKIRLDTIDLRLGDIKNSISSLLLEISDNISLKPLPIPKNKRLIQSFNWLIFYPSSKLSSTNEVFDSVNEIVNEKFRMYGAKQFHLEDIETASTFLEDIVIYFSNNKVIKTINKDYIDFSDFIGESLANFSRLFGGFIRQKYKQEAEEIVSNYILYLSEMLDSKKKDNKYNPYIFAYQLFNSDKKVGQNPTLDFFVYASITTGELAKYLNYSLVYEKIVEQSKKIKEKLESPYLHYGYFITAKKRGAAIRSLSEMREVIQKYFKNCIENKEIRLCYDYLYLSKLYLELLRETEISVNEVEKIKSDIEKKLQIIETSKKYLNINEEIEESKKIREIIDMLENKFESIMNNIASKIQKINEEGKTEDFKKFLDYLLTVIGIEDNLNLYFIIFKLLKEVLNGIQIIGIEREQLNETIIGNIASLSKIGNQISRLEAIVNEVEKISPELPKVREAITRKRKKVEELIQEIKEMIEDYDA
ncbi:MAG: hypothetical protein QXQ01_04475 [Saccharolobus sp.]